MPQKYLTVEGNTSRKPESRLVVPVKVLDERSRAGNRDYLVTPVGGAGQAWVEETKLSDEKPAQ